MVYFILFVAFMCVLAENSGRKQERKQLQMQIAEQAETLKIAKQLLKLYGFNNEIIMRVSLDEHAKIILANRHYNNNLAWRNEQIAEQYCKKFFNKNIKNL